MGESSRRMQAPRSSLKPISHRANGFGFLENSSDAIRAAVRAKVPTLELDARITRDGVVVVSHDAEPPGSHDGCTIEESDYRDLPREIPTLYEALAVIGADVCLNLEIKPTAKDLTPLLRLIEPIDNIYVSSFDWRILREVRAASPERNLAVLVPPHAQCEDVFTVVRELQAVAIHISVEQMRNGWIDKLHSALGSVPIYVYTANDPGVWDEAVSAGAAGVFTDRIDVLRDWVAEEA